MTMMTFSQSRSSHEIYKGNSVFDPWLMQWSIASALPDDLIPVKPLEALVSLGHLGKLRSVPVAIIGPRQADPSLRDIAEQLGGRIHQAGLTLLTGGMSGVMEAASAGNFKAGGRPVAFLPGEDWREANPYVAVPLATGIRQARNALIARAAFALIAVGGGYGTLSEMAYGLHFDRLVISMMGAPSVEGALQCSDVNEAMAAVAQRYFA